MWLFTLSFLQTYCATCADFYIMMCAATAIFVGRAKLRKNAAARIAAAIGIALTAGLLASVLIYGGGMLPAFATILMWTAAYIILSASSFLIFAVTTETNTVSLLYSSLAGYATKHMSEALFFVFIALTEYEDVLSVKSFGYYAIRLIFRAAVYIPIYFLFARRRNKNEADDIKISAPLLATLIFLYLFPIVLNLARTLFASESTILNMLLLAAIFVFCLETLILRHTKLEKIFIEEELDTLTRIWKEKEKVLIESKENAELISIKYHDLRHCMAQLGTDEKRKNEYLTEIDEAINIYDSAVHTGNEACDAVLIDKHLFCHRNGIRFSAIADGSVFDSVTSTDTVALLSNITENAINAVLELPKESRSISLIIKKTKNVGSIVIENPYTGDIIFENGLPATRKDRSVHGFGMKSIKMIVEKYGGEMTVKTNDGIFGLYIVIPQKEPCTKN